MGTVFLACEESGASRLHRETLRRRNAGHTALTKGFTGRLARAIHNRVMENLNRNGTEILPYPLQLVRNLAIAAEAAGRADLVPMWAGQSANLSTCTDVSAFLSSLVEELSESWTGNSVERKPQRKRSRAWGGGMEDWQTVSTGKQKFVLLMSAVIPGLGTEGEKGYAIWSRDGVYRRSDLAFSGSFGEPSLIIRNQSSSSRWCSSVSPDPLPVAR
jgi:Nitronate monooxygenase